MSQRTLGGIYGVTFKDPTSSVKFHGLEQHGLKVQVTQLLFAFHAGVEQEKPEVH